MNKKEGWLAMRSVGSMMVWARGATRRAETVGVYSPLSLCPVCDGRAVVAFVVRTHPVLECERCEHRYVAPPEPDHVAVVYDDAYFAGAAGGYGDYLSGGDDLRERGRSYGELLSRYGPTGRLLDIGAAAGYVLRGLTDVGWSGRGIEPNETMAARARDDLGLDVETASFEDFDQAGRYDAITMVQVLPHLPDPRRAVARAHELLEPDGLLLIETWNRESHVARATGRFWHEYNPPSVLHWFSADSLVAFCASEGFELVEMGQPKKWLPLVNVSPWLARHHLGTAAAWVVGKSGSRWGFSYPGDDAFWVLLRRV